MKNKILILLVGLLVLVGCSTVSSSDEVRDDGLYDVYEQVKCVNGKKIWIMQFIGSYKGALTSQIVGECDQ